MATYTKRQNKKTLGIEGLKGVTVLNLPTGKRYNVKFRAEVSANGANLQRGTFATAQEAAEQANAFFKQTFGGIRAAKKAGYWNETV